MKSALAAVLIAVVVPASAQSWVAYAETEGGEMLEWQPSSAKVEAAWSRVVVWTRSTLKKPQPMFKNKATPKWTQAKVRFALYCKAEQIQELYAVYYDGHGDAIYTQETEAASHPVTPDSTGAVLLSLACSVVGGDK